MARVVVMLASEAGNAITGHVLCIDGGYRVGFPGNPQAERGLYAS
jgi:hypothetical protein